MLVVRHPFKKKNLLPFGQNVLSLCLTPPLGGLRQISTTTDTVDWDEIRICQPIVLLFKCVGQDVQRKLQNVFEIYTSIQIHFRKPVIVSQCQLNVLLAQVR